MKNKKLIGSEIVYELTQSGDNNEYGIIVWCGTENKTAALRKLHRLAKTLVNVKPFKKVK